MAIDVWLRHHDPVILGLNRAAARSRLDCRPGLEAGICRRVLKIRTASRTTPTTMRGLRVAAGSSAASATGIPATAGLACQHQSQETDPSIHVWAPPIRPGSSRGTCIPGREKSLVIVVVSVMRAACLSPSTLSPRSIWRFLQNRDAGRLATTAEIRFAMHLAATLAFACSTGAYGLSAPASLPSLRCHAISKQQDR